MINRNNNSIHIEVIEGFSAAKTTCGVIASNKKIGFIAKNYSLFYKNFHAKLWLIAYSSYKEGIYLYRGNIILNF